MDANRQEKKAQKKAYKKARRKFTGLWKALTSISAPLLVIFIAASIVVGMFDNTVALFTGATFWELENRDPSAVYYEEDFATQEERVNRGYELAKQVEGEGAALLYNADSALPLGTGAKVSLFSTSSVSLVYGGTGSANVDASKADNLRSAMERPGSRSTAPCGTFISPVRAVPTRECPAALPAALLWVRHPGAHTPSPSWTALPPTVTQPS